MHPVLKLLLAVPLALAAAAASAQEEEGGKRGFYLAPEGGLITFRNIDCPAECDDEGTIILSGPPRVTMDVACPTCDDEGNVFGVAGGWRFNDVLAAEGGFRFAEAGVTSDVNLEFTSYSAGARGFISVSERFSLTGKAGWHFWRRDADEPLGDADGADPYFGAGISINSDSGGGALNAEYSRFIAGDMKADVISIGFIWHF